MSFLPFFLTLVEALFVAAALSLDAFAVSFSYGMDKIKLPAASFLLIDLVCSLSVGSTLLAGSLLKNRIPIRLAGIICFFILFFLGLFKLYDSIFRFVQNHYTDAKYVDTDHSKTISPKEAVLLAVTLSLDGVAAGFGSALGNINGIAVFLCSLFTEGAALFLGLYLGNRAAGKCSCNISFLGGLILLALAFFKLT